MRCRFNGKIHSQKLQKNPRGGRKEHKTHRSTFTYESQLSEKEEENYDHLYCRIYCHCPHMFEIRLNSFSSRRSQLIFFPAWQMPVGWRCIRNLVISCDSHAIFFFTFTHFLSSFFHCCSAPYIFGPLAGDAREKLTAWSRHFEWETRFALTVIPRVLSFSLFRSRIDTCVSRYLSFVHMLAFVLCRCRPFTNRPSDPDRIFRFDNEAFPPKYLQYIDGPFSRNTKSQL